MLYFQKQNEAYV